MAYWIILMCKARPSPFGEAKILAGFFPGRKKTQNLTLEAQIQP